MKEAKYNLAQNMYKMYGIAEWTEKCIVLTLEEQISVLKDLQEGIESELVTLVKLPFPHFAEKYFSSYPAAQEYLKNPDFGYRLYMVSDSIMKMFTERVRNPELTIKDLKRIYGCEYKKAVVNEILLNTRFEDITRMTGFNDKYNAMRYNRKFVYLTQYIDLEEAKRLDLKIAVLFERDGVDGFELASKLSLLNTSIRIIITKFLGLYGSNPCLVVDIAEEMKLPEEVIYTIVNTLLPTIIRPLGEFKNKIGYKPDDRGDAVAPYYTNKKYSYISVYAEITYIFNNLPENVKEKLLSSRTKKEIGIYIARAYMEYTDDQIMTVFNITLKELEDAISKGSI